MDQSKTRSCGSGCDIESNPMTPVKLLSQSIVECTRVQLSIIIAVASDLLAVITSTGVVTGQKKKRVHTDHLQLMRRKFIQQVVRQRQFSTGADAFSRDGPQPGGSMLLLRPKWLDLILHGSKTMESRGQNLGAATRYLASE